MKNILVVENSLENMELVECLLEYDGYKVEKVFH